MSEIDKAIALSKKIDERASMIVRGMHDEIAAHCRARPAFMAIMLGAVHAKIGRLLAAVEQEARKP